jgi:Peptidase family C25/Secretion system C-terminal sorting domain
MKRVQIILIVLMTLATSLNAESIIIDLCLIDEIDAFQSKQLLAKLSSSNKWQYGLSSDGSPVFRHRLSLPANEKPELKEVHAFSEEIIYGLEFEDIFAPNICTNSEAYSMELNQPFSELRYYDQIQAGMIKQISLGGIDYYDILIQPFDYDYENHEVKFYSNLEIEIELTANTVSTWLQPENQMTYLLGEISGDNFTYSQKTWDYSNSLAFNSNPDYIIITNAELSTEFEPFVQWKRALGYNTQIKLIEEIEVEEIGDDLAAKVREYLKHAYQNGLEWMLIGGDETIVPIRKFYPANTDDDIPFEYQHPSDLYYGDLTGEWDVDGDGIWGEPYYDNPDLQPEIFVGRVPANCPQDVINWVQKSIYYENGGVFSTENYAKKVLITSADHMRDWNFGYGQDSLIAEYLPAYITPDLNSMAEYPSGNDRYPTQAPAPQFIDKYSEGWNLTYILAHGTSEGFVSMSAGYNEWPKTYVFTGSSTHASHGFLDDLSNHGKAGVIYSVACANGAIDYDQPPINSQRRSMAEAFLILEESGAVAFIGYSRYGWVASSYKLAEKFTECIYNSDNRLGPANTYSKLYYSNYRDLNYGLNLFGDPSLPIWIETPIELETNNPEIITLGDNIFELDVTANNASVENALVTIITSDENLFHGYTDINGHIDIEFNSGIDSCVILTISKNGMIPYQKTIATSIILDADDDDRPAVPTVFSLYQNYPNPANPSTTISFNLPDTDDITLEIYNILGQKTEELAENSLAAGYHEVYLDLSEYASGVYFYRLTTSNGSDTKKLTLLK